MARWTDLAPRQEHTANQGGAMVEVRGVVLHIAEGTYEGTISWQKNPTADVSSHFIAAKKDGACQMVDTAVAAWTQKAGNGHWLSIENEGSVPDALSAHQVEFAAQILARAHREYDVPLQVTSDPDGRGLGHHSMGAHPGYPDDWGHSSCPGKAIIDQKPAIVARAKEIVEGDDMPTGLIGLKKGDTGEEVRGLQNLLRNSGYTAPDSGTYDSTTVAAVKAMRADMGTADSDGTTISGNAYGQLIRAVAKAYAAANAGQVGPPGEKGDKGDPGPAGTLPPGTVLELSGGTATVAGVTVPAAGPTG